jgi:hypothetical protein
MKGINDGMVMNAPKNNTKQNECKLKGISKKKYPLHKNKNSAFE